MLVANKIAVRRDLIWDNIHDKTDPQWSEMTEMVVYCETHLVITSQQPAD